MYIHIYAFGSAQLYLLNLGNLAPTLVSNIESN